jgi:hypothetical protein
MKNLSSRRGKRRSSVNNLKLITTADYLLLVEPYAQHTKMPFMKTMASGNIEILDNEEAARYGGCHIIAHRPLHDNAPVLDSALLLPELKDEVPDSAIEAIFGCKADLFQKKEWNWFKKVYKAAASQKKWSDEDMVNFTEWYLRIRMKRLTSIQTAEDSRTTKEAYVMLKNRPISEWLKEYAQSLSPKPVGFEPETYGYWECHNYGGAHLGRDCSCKGGDLREVNKLKTTKVTFRGKEVEVLTGKYIYE